MITVPRDPLPVENVVSPPPLADLSVYGDEPEDLRFSLKELFIATTVAAVLLALVRVVGIFGAVASFVAAILFTFYIYPRLQSNSLGAQRRMFDFVWGVVMPVVCLIFDPIVFRHDPRIFEDVFSATQSPLTSPDKVYPYGYVAYFAIGLQIAMLGLWLAFGKRLRNFSAVISGVLAVGATVALGIGALLCPAALLGMLYFGIGLLGFTPLLTGFVYVRAAKQAYATAKREQTKYLGEFVLLGVVLGIVLPFALPLAILLGLQESGLLVAYFLSRA